MRNVPRRLQKLEARLTDRCGLAPHRQTWFKHWSANSTDVFDQKDASVLKGMPLEFMDEMIDMGRREMAAQKSSTRAGRM